MAADPGFGEVKLIRRMREILEEKECKHLAKIDFSELAVIIDAYLKALKEIEAEEAIEREREEKIKQAERISEKDVGWFPGDCCD